MADSLPLPAGYRLFAMDTIDSTNAEALRRMAADARAGDVIWAKRQSAGRGRRGREWVSADGNLFLTLIVHVPEERSVGQLAFVAGVAVAGALKQVVGDEEVIRLKWPNDILMAGCKLGGILIERSGEQANADLVAVGIGVNVAQVPYPGAACLGDTGNSVSLLHLLERVCAEFDNSYGVWRVDGFAPVREAWLACADGLTQPITVRFPDGRTTAGQFRGIDQNGGLELWRADGTCEMIATGEVFFATA